LFLASPFAGASELECGENSGVWVSFGAQDYASSGFTNGMDACRASRQGLKDELVGLAGGYSCADSDCTIASCNTKIECDTVDCAQVVTTVPLLDHATGLYGCISYWNYGEGRVYCTPCDHI